MNTEDDDKYLSNDDDNSEDYVNESGSLYPYSKDVDLQKIEVDLREDKMSVFELMRKIESKKFIFDPEFQRSDKAWKVWQKSMFIESLILNIPIPPFYFNQAKNGHFIVVDGLQRCTAIKDFLDKKYRLEELKALPWLNGKDCIDLKEEFPDIYARIEDKSILFFAIKPSVPMPVIYDIFKRINTGGTVLQRQEIRNCIYLGKSTRLLKRLAESDEFTTAIDKGIKPERMKDREAVLRCIAFAHMKSLGDYKGNLDEYLGIIMNRLNLMDDEEIAEIESKFKKIMILIRHVLSKNAFRIPTEWTRGVINLALMEATYAFFYSFDEDKIQEREAMISQNYKKLLKDSVFLDSVKSSTGSLKKIEYRLNKCVNILMEGIC
ncbi:MAG: DUF262 domain-containing protein [Marinagarivorans sp.]